MKGFIKLHRDIVNSDIYQMPPLYLRVFERLLLEANHEDAYIPYREKGTNITGKKLIKRGERLTSIRHISEWVGWYERGILKVPNPKTITTILDWLTQNNMIQIYNQGNRQETHYNVVNYCVYQDKTSNESNTQVTEKKQSTDINKNDKNDKNDKKLKDIADKPQTQKFIPPTLEEIKEYCFERNNNVDAERFVNFYQSKGWMVGKNKMTDWKASVRTWEQKQKEFEPQQKVSNGNVFLELLKGRNGTNDNG